MIHWIIRWPQSPNKQFERLFSNITIGKGIEKITSIAL